MSVWCVTVREIEETHDNEIIYIHLGPFAFSSKDNARDYICTNVLIPQLEEFLYDEEPNLVEQYKHIFDGRHIREEYRYEYEVLDKMARALLHRFINWTIVCCIVNSELEDVRQERKRLKV